MFDSLGCNGRGHRRPHEQRAHSCQAAFRSGSVASEKAPRCGDEDAATATKSNQHALGKGHLPYVEKNMPSIVGVFGDVDRLYRPELTTQLFGPPLHTVSDAVVQEAKQKATERSNQASCNYVPIKPFNGHNEVHWVSTKDGGHVGGVGIESGSPSYAAALRERHNSDASALHQTKVLMQRAAALEHQLAACDSRIQRHRDEVGTLQGLRDVHIAKKKSKLRRLRADRTLDHQDASLLNALSHTAAERTANRNVMTADRCVPTFVSGGGIPGTEGYTLAKRLRRGGSGRQEGKSSSSGPTSTRGQATPPSVEGCVAGISAQPTASTPPTQQPTATTSMGGTAASATPNGDTATTTVRNSAAWQQAVRIGPMGLMDRVGIPVLRCTTTEPHRGPRVFPNLHSRTAPFAAEENLAMPRREMTHARMSTPVKWFEREVKRTVDGYNRSVVFTPHLRTAPQGVRAPTIPAPACSSSSIGSDGGKSIALSVEEAPAD